MQCAQDPKDVCALRLDKCGRSDRSLELSSRLTPGTLRRFEALSSPSAGPAPAALLALRLLSIALRPDDRGRIRGERNLGLRRTHEIFW